MASSKPPRAPAFDAKTFSRRLYERVTQANGSPYAVFDYENDAGDPIGFPRFKTWIERLRDSVNANAVYLDAVKEDIDTHKAADLARHQSLDARVTALEEAQSTVPFPGST